MTNNLSYTDNEFDIAIVGMAGRFPGAKNIAKFWDNLRSGVESITFFTDEELKAAGVDPALLNDPNYVKAAPTLDDPSLFDASFFGYSPREARFMDPQHRLFLECAWEALEHAGYDPEEYQAPIGIYGGAAMNTYLLFSGLLPHFVTEYLPTLIGNDNSFLATRVAYKLNLTGPSVTVQTACSTSSVAIHMACQSLLNAECDLALAGGVSVRVPHQAGHLYQEGSVFTPDGHCRPFDAQAQGTIFGSGVGVVALKRLSDALAEGDYIHAIIKGSAINNDGSAKTDYTAPSVNSQAEVIIEALANAGIEADTLSYVEAHGTGTYLGDPIEVTALTRAFRLYTEKNQFCALGSVKSNIGHLDAAAGVTGLLKTVLALKNKLIPPSLHFKEPNPEISFENTPFYVNDTLSKWNTNGAPRRAGVSSLGIGGTNAHIILEEAPVPQDSGPSRPWYLLPLSAKTDSALESATANLAQYLKQQPDANLADMAYTLQVGRQRFDHRRVVVCQNRDEAITLLQELNPKRVVTKFQKPINQDIVFMFPGGGAQYPNMGLEMYQYEPVFRAEVDHCLALLKPHLDIDLKSFMYPAEGQETQAAEQLKLPSLALPALFTIEYALAKLWMSWGIQPAAMIGHSLGEYTAACLAGVLSLEDALFIVALRGRLFEQLPTGAMLSVPLSEAEARPYMSDALSFAAINGPALCVVSGPTPAIAKMETALAAKGVEARRLKISVAAHSEMVEEILAEFSQHVQKITCHAPRIPCVSNVSGTWLTPAEAEDPLYWVKHLRQTVRFADGLTNLLSEPQRVFLEVGPGHTLSTLTRRHPDKKQEQIVQPAMRHPYEQISDQAFLLLALGQLWLANISIDWTGFYTDEQRRRLPLPTYPFERQQYWSQAKQQGHAAALRQESLAKKPNIDDWFYIPSWKRTALPGQLQVGNVLADQKYKWVIFVDGQGIGTQIAQRLKAQNQTVVTVKAAQQFVRHNENSYSINPQKRDDYLALTEALVSSEQTPDKIIHLWSVTANDQNQTSLARLEAVQTLGFYSLLFLAQALAEQHITEPLKIDIVSNHVHEVTGGEELHPEKATILGPSRVISKEFPNIAIHYVDINLPESETPPAQKLIEQLITEFTQKSANDFVAYRGHHRWTQTFEPVHLAGASPDVRKEAITETTRLRKGGVYLITGGLGGLGLAMAKFLAQTVQAKLALLGRSAFPPPEKWKIWLASHDDQDEISHKIRQVQELKQLGAEVLIFSADVSKEEQIQPVIDKIHKQFGPIQGVIHAAGTINDGLISLKAPEVAANVLAPKVEGTLVLDNLLKNEQLDFLILFSSINSILAPAGQADYSAANAFLDAFSHYKAAKSGYFTATINWPGWQEVGIVANRKTLPGSEAWREEALKKGISPSEGVEIFQRLLASNLSQLIVSTENFPLKIEHSASKAEPAAPSPPISSAETKQIKPENAPRNEIEQKIANIWQEFLGVEQVGIHDNFSELGGHSLLATQIASRLRKVFDVEFSVRDLFETPTISELAEHTQKLRKEIQDEAEKITRLLSMIDKLDDDEVQTLTKKM